MVPVCLSAARDGEVAAKAEAETLAGTGSRVGARAGREEVINNVSPVSISPPLIHPPQGVNFSYCTSFFRRELYASKNQIRRKLQEKYAYEYECVLKGLLFFLRLSSYVSGG